MDKDENGRIDTKFFSTVIEGQNVDVYLFDAEEDGEFDVAGVDFDQDGTPDRYQNLTP